jgi:hypothetical protein
MGPAGMGPRSGRAAGCCAGFVAPGLANPRPGRGRGRAFGRGGGGVGRGSGGFRRERAWGGRPYGAPWDTPVPDPAAERQALKSQAEALRARLQAIERRLAEGEETRDAE